MCATLRCARQASERNLRKALLMLETCRVAQYPFTPDQPVQLADWELYIQVQPMIAPPADKDTPCIPERHLLMSITAGRTWSIF